MNRWADGPISSAYFSGPTGIVYSNNVLYICDYNTFVIRKYNINTQTVNTIIGNPSITMSIDGPRSTFKYAFDPTCVNQYGNIYNFNGTFSERFISQATPTSKFDCRAASIYEPTFICVSPDGNKLFFTENTNQLVRCADIVGNQTYTIYNFDVNTFTGGGQYIYGITIDNNGSTLYTTAIDSSYNYIIKIDISRWLSSKATSDVTSTTYKFNKSSPDSEFNSIAIDTSGEKLYICDYSSEVIYRQSISSLTDSNPMDPTLLIDLPGAPNGDTTGVTDITIDASNNIYIADNAAKLIYIYFYTNGQWSSYVYIPLNSTFSPYCISLDSKTNPSILYYTDYHNNICGRILLAPWLAYGNSKSSNSTSSISIRLP
jgi:sugar lactone lactonase YvrE